jgi:hypothetical protein
MISSSATGRPSVSYSVPPVDTASQPLPRRSQHGNDNAGGGGGTMVFNAALGSMTPPTRSSVAASSSRGGRCGTAAGAVAGAAAPPQAAQPCGLLPCLAHWERHTASDPVAANAIVLLRSIAQSAHGCSLPPSETEAAQREPLVQQTEVLVDDVLSTLEARMAQLMSEAQAFSSSDSAVVDDGDAIVQRLCGAMASVEWMLCCGSLSLLRRELGHHVRTRCLGEVYATKVQPRQNSDRDVFQVWGRAIACVEILLEAARDIVIQMGAAATAAALLDSPDLRYSWRSLGKLMGKCASWIAVDRGSGNDNNLPPTTTTTTTRAIAMLGQGDAVTLLLDVLGAKATGVFQDDGGDSLRVFAEFMESFNSQYFGDLDSRKRVMGGGKDETPTKKMSPAATVLVLGGCGAGWTCPPAVDVESIGMPQSKPSGGQKRKSGPRQFESVFSTEWNSTGKYFAMCVALGVMLRQQIRPGRIPTEKLLSLKGETEKEGGGGGGGGGGKEGCFGQVSRRVAASFARNGDEENDGAVDVDLIQVFVHSAEKWVHHFTKRSGVLATNISARMPAAAAATFKSANAKTATSLSQLRAHHTQFVDECCVCFMDLSRLLSGMQTNHRAKGRLSRLERIRARLYLIIVRSSAAFGMDTETSVHATTLSQCCDVVTPGGDAEVSPPSELGVNVRPAGMLLLRSVVESIVTQRRSALAWGGNSKAAVVAQAAAAHAALHPCVVAALMRIGTAPGTVLAEELLRGLVELAHN